MHPLCFPACFFSGNFDSHYYISVLEILRRSKSLRGIFLTGFSEFDLVERCVIKRIQSFQRGETKKKVDKANRSINFTREYLENVYQSEPSTLASLFAKYPARHITPFFNLSLGSMRPALYRVVSLRVHALCFALQYCELPRCDRERERERERDDWEKPERNSERGM